MKRGVGEGELVGVTLSVDVGRGVGVGWGVSEGIGVFWGGCGGNKAEVSAGMIGFTIVGFLPLQPTRLNKNMRQNNEIVLKK
jgi:hypothetical protein